MKKKNVIKRYLGNICKRGHEHKNTGKTLRLRSSGDCVACAKMRRELKRSLRGTQKIDPVKTDSRATIRKKQEARAHASLHCVRFDGCLRDAWDDNEEMKCYQCEDFEFSENNYQKNMTTNIFYRDVRRYPVSGNINK